jgi:membrane-bound lytic murein transglycosylase B
MGLPQFMPSSINRFAVDFDGDGHIDLQRSPADVIGSVAHYLRSMAGSAGCPPTLRWPRRPTTADRAALLAPDILPSFTPRSSAERAPC